MRYSYFPGCTLHAQARNFEVSALATARVLGLELSELTDWQCCGAVFPLTTDNHLPLVSPYRSLASAHTRGENLVTMCAGCYNVLKRTNAMVKEDEEVRVKLGAFVGEEYSGEREVLHFLEVLRDTVGFDALREMVSQPLEGLSVAAYYGCLLLRPPEEMKFDDPEYPTIMEDFLTALGASVVDYPYRIECCGAYLAITNETEKGEPSRAILKSAIAHHASCLITSCPLCQYNLDVEQSRMNSDPEPMPVLYFTQLLALALGLGEESCNFSLHHVDPRPVLAQAGLIGGE